MAVPSAFPLGCPPHAGRAGWKDGGASIEAGMAHWCHGPPPGAGAVIERMTATASRTGTRPDIALGYHTVAISPTQLAAVAADVEELGIDSLWMAETKHDPFVGLAVAAARTGRVRVN